MAGIKSKLSGGASAVVLLVAFNLSGCTDEPETLSVEETIAKVTELETQNLGNKLSEKFTGNTMDYYKDSADENGVIPKDVAYCDGENIIDGTSNEFAYKPKVVFDGRCIKANLVFQPK